MEPVTGPVICDPSISGKESSERRLDFITLVQYYIIHLDSLRLSLSYAQVRINCSVSYYHPSEEERKKKKNWLMSNFSVRGVVGQLIRGSTAAG